jgi:hypothetical protein
VRVATLTNFHRQQMTPRMLRFALVVAVLAAPATSDAQFSRFGRGSKPDTSAAAKARADSIAKAGAANTDSAAAPAPQAKRGRFSLGGMVSGATSRVVGTIASVAGNVMTGSTADLGTVVPIVYRVSNLWPKSSGTMLTKLFSNWTDGGDMVTVSFTQRLGAMMSKIDGTVIVAL